MTGNDISTKVMLPLFFIVLLLGCNDSGVFTPKPKMYPRIDFPINKGYSDAPLWDCPFSFNIPSYAEIDWNVTIDGVTKQRPCWFDIKFPDLKSTIHFSYYDISGAEKLEQRIQESFRLASEHNVKADYREESLIRTPNGTYGIRYDLNGQVATPLSFYLTDSIHHFVRGALYFNSKVNPDSTAPVLRFLNRDVDSLIASFKFDR